MAKKSHDRGRCEEQAECVCSGGSSWTLAAVVVLLGFIPGAARAGIGINLRPGAAEPCDVNVNRNDVAGPVADLDQYVGSSVFDWAIVNDGSPGTASLPDAEHVFFETNSGTGLLEATSQFDMSFDMALTSLGQGGPIYGQDSAMAALFTDNTLTTSFTSAYPSHVVMTASLEGGITTTHGLDELPIYNLVRSVPYFTKGVFFMYFDEDGDPASVGDRVLIAKFGAYAAPSPPPIPPSFATTWTISQAVGSIIVNWDAALPGVFADANGNEIAIGAADPNDPTLRGVNSAGTSQVEVDFKFECASSGAFGEIDSSNHLRLRLHMLGGSFSVYSVPATTTAPAALCPPVLQKVNRVLPVLPVRVL
jgi:hypothetical protein